MPAAAATRTITTITVPTVPVEASQAAAAPTTAADGSVSVQAITICPATPHCTEARHLADPLAQSLDDPPAPRVGAQRDREPGSEDHPERRPRVRGEHARGDQRERDDAHR